MRGCFGHGERGDGARVAFAAMSAGVGLVPDQAVFLLLALQPGDGALDVVFVFADFFGMSRAEEGQQRQSRSRRYRLFLHRPYFLASQWPSGS